MNGHTVSSAARAMHSLRHLRVRLFFSNLLVGAITGAVISLYRLGIRAVAGFVRPLVEKGHTSWQAALVALGVFATLGVLSALLLKWEPNISGSGIPQIAAELSGRLKTKWYRVLPLKFLGGLLSLGGGLTLGREGPSVQVGGAVGHGVAAVLKRPKSEMNYLITGGAAAGLAAAFNAPISGVVFALEELHRHFSPRVLLSAMTAAFVADFVSANIFGFAPVLSFRNVPLIPLSAYWTLLLVGLAGGLSGMLFSKGILYAKGPYARMRGAPFWVRGMLPFILTCAVLLKYPDLFGSGEEFIFLPLHGNLPLERILLIYLVKLLLVWLAFGSGIAGGIFFPLLVLGSLAGNALAQLMVLSGLAAPELVLTLSLLAMAAHFAAIVRSPLTGVLLIAEMTGSFAFMLPLGIVCLTAYMTAEALKSTPIYENLLELLPGVHAGADAPKQDAVDEQRVIREFVVREGSPAAGLRIRDIAWPKGVLVVTVMRGTQELSPVADLTLSAGDYLLLLARERAFAANLPALQEMLGR